MPSRPDHYVQMSAWTRSGADTGSFDVIACLGMTLLGISDHISALTALGPNNRCDQRCLGALERRGCGEPPGHMESNTPRWPVSIAEWVHHEVNTLNLVRALAPGSTLVTRLEAYVDEVLPQLTAEQHFHVFLGTMG